MPPKKRDTSEAPTENPGAVVAAVEAPTEPATSPTTTEELTAAETAETELRWAVQRLVEQVMATQPQPRLNSRADYKAGHIFGAFHAVMNDVRGVGKHGQMDPSARMGNYSYRKYDDLKRELGEACRTHGVALQSTIHNVVNEIRGNMQRVQVLITYRFTSLEDGTEMTFDSLGESCDRGDKATGKAMTMALKTAMDQAFMLAAEDIDDPDASRPEPGLVESFERAQDAVAGPRDGRGPLARTPERVMREAQQRTYQEGEPVPPGGHQVGDQREVAGMTFTKHSDGPGYPNEAPAKADAWDTGPVQETRTPAELAQAAAAKVEEPGLTLAKWEQVAGHARTLEIMDQMVTTKTGEEMQLKRYLVALGKTL